MNLFENNIFALIYFCLVIGLIVLFFCIIYSVH
ncbi:Protein of unknown function [Bacillus mycoides]|nr:Protein of unknown function [Bacillus mycoides]